MKAIMNLKDLKNTQELQTFLKGSQSVAFSVPGDKTARYTFIQSTLKQFHYRALNKRQKGIVIRFLLQVTQYSCQQLTRLIHQYQESGVVQQHAPHKPPSFKQKYTSSDIALLAEMDERHNIRQAVLLLKNSVNAPIQYLMKLSMKTLPLFRCRICTICAVPLAIRNNEEPLIKPSLGKLLLVKGANLTLMENQAIFEWIPFIKAIRMV